ncbi:MAG: efflux RND transporter periplasmic adaptor subunit [Candidatus Latescibacteria bacterium]|nr:efflux RND transporter periplasmic adaptor subunit [Candidatus Latescibacterota bacterium]
MRAYWIVWVFGLGLLAGCSMSGADGKLEFSGTLESTRMTVRALTPGVVVALPFSEGAQVATGQTVALIDTTDAMFARASRRAQLDLAEAQLRLLLRGARPEDLAQATHALHQAEAALRGAEDDLKRVSALSEVSSATQKQKDDAEVRHEMAAHQAAQAAELLRKLKNGALPEELDAARARVAQARAELAVAEKAVADCRLTAPWAAVVTEKLVEIGDIAQRYGALMTLTRLDPITLKLYIPEADVGRLHVGDQAAVRIDADPNRSFTGRVSYIAPEAQFTPKNVQTKDERVRLVFEVKVEIPNPDGTLKPGLPADATLGAGR